MRLLAALPLVAFAAVSAACNTSKPAASSAAYAPPSSCAGCHDAIWKTFRNSGMGRSFAAFRADAAPAGFTVRNMYYHPASGRRYRMYIRDGRAFMRRYQSAPHGGEVNVVEKQIDYVIGSGYKVLTFLHRNAADELIQLPVAWYPGSGGYWAMNPGYDRPDHDDFRRRVRYDCFFCHNAYPAVQSDSFYGDAVYPPRLPEGIDCQRCHGPGQAHLDAASARAPEEQIRAAIVNPRRLDPARRLDACLQCHLQSTSRALPYAVQRLDRGVFSFRPGERLGDYVTHFDHAPGSGHDNKFEIAHAGYRLMKSACFTRAGGKLDCVTCHNPHEPLARGSAYDHACATCHPRLPAAHSGKVNCASCHMPQRRTDDVVHVAMTDHKIQRTPVAGLLAARREIAETPANAYQGPVIPYYPPQPSDEITTAVAAVRAGSYLREGLPKLAALRSDRAEFYYELAEAYWKTRDATNAFRAYELCLQRDSSFLPCLRAYGMALSSAGDAVQGARILERALAVAPRDARALHDLGLNLMMQGRAADAIVRLRLAIESDPDVAETHNALASALYETGDAAGAEREFREAIRVQPDYAMARQNLARFLAERGGGR